MGIGAYTGDPMRRWLLWGREVHDDLHDEIYVQFIANVMSALVTAGMIGLYHVAFHL